MTTEQRDDLIARSEQRLHRLLEFVDELGAEDAELGALYKGRTTADVLAHLHAWHVVLEGWCRIGAAGGSPAMPADGYTWEDLEAFNDALYDDFAGNPYAEVRDLLLDTHGTCVDLLETHSDEQLFSPARYPWTHGQPLARLFDACMAEHYDWAITLLSTWAKAREPYRPR